MAYCQRQEQQPLRVQLREGGGGIDGLERAVELLCEGSFVFLAGEYIGNDRFVVGGEIELHKFVGHRPRSVVE